MKRIAIIIVSIFITSLAYSAPSNTVSIPNSFVANTTIESDKVNGNFNEVSSKYNSHSHTDLTQVGTITSGTWNGTAISSQYGGTGQDFSGSAQGSIIYFSGTGTMSTLPAGTAGQILSTNGVGANPSWSSGGSASNAITRGFEASASTLKASIVVYSGTLFVGSSIVESASNSTLTITTASDYSSGSVVTYGSGAGWNYIGVNSSGLIRFLGNCPPTRSDTLGRANGTKYYSYEKNPAGTLDNWRVIGAVRVNTSDQCAVGYNQRGNMITLESPLSLTTTPSAAAWSSPLDCSAGMPSISTFGIFGCYSYENAQDSALSLRANGTLGLQPVQSGGGIYQQSGGAVEGELVSATDSSQQIQYYNDTGDTATAIVLKAYTLDIR